MQGSIIRESCVFFEYFWLKGKKMGSRRKAAEQIEVCDSTFTWDPWRSDESPECISCLTCNEQSVVS